MFRGITRSKIDPDNFGVGSYVIEHKDVYMAVATSENGVRLLNMQTFQLIGASVSVEDINFLSQDETRELVKSLGGTFTDYDYIPKGMKK